MKKHIAILTILFAAALAPAAAQSNMSFGFGVGFPNQSFSFPGSELTSSGIGLAGQSLYGGDFGFLSSYTFGFVQSAKAGSASFPLSSYDFKIAFDGLFGLGYRFDVMPSVRVLAGGGFHMGELILMPSSAYGVSATVLALGVGAVGSAEYRFSQTMGIAASLELAYDFAQGIASYDLATGDMKSAFSVVPAILLVF